MVLEECTMDSYEPLIPVPIPPKYFKHKSTQGTRLRRTEWERTGHHRKVKRGCERTDATKQETIILAILQSLSICNSKSDCCLFWIIDMKSRVLFINLPHTYSVAYDIPPWIRQKECIKSSRIYRMSLDYINNILSLWLK